MGPSGPIRDHAGVALSTPSWPDEEGVDALVVSVLRVRLGGQGDAGSPALASIADGPGVAVVAAVAHGEGADLVERAGHPPAWALAGSRRGGTQRYEATLHSLVAPLLLADLGLRPVVEQLAGW